MSQDNKKYDYMITVLFSIYGIPERILREGIECLCNQTYKDARFLVVNDCSPDEYTLGVINEYAAKDKRIHVINQTKNGGLAKARSLGIDMAQNSKYFTLFDPDDLIPENYLQVLVDNAEYYDADMVTVKIVEFHDGEKVDITNNVKSSDYFKLKLPLKTRRLYRQKFICRLFKIETIGDLRFNAKLVSGEDLLFINQYLVRCKKCVDIKFPAYFYRHGRVFGKNETVIARRPKRKVTIDNFLYYIPVWEEFSKLLEECKTKAELRYVKYMLIRRYTRNIFATRKAQLPENEKYMVYQKYYVELIKEPAKSYLIFNKIIDKLFLQEDMPSNFYCKLDVLRLYFELMHTVYHIRKSCHKLKLKIFGVA